MKILLIMLTTFFIPVVLAVNPVHIVYRADDRSLSVIQSDGGMWPWGEGQPDDDLTHHFEGESIEERHSNFVSTTSGLREVVMHAASLARPNSEEPFDENFVTYIYEIRPATNFYSVDEALRTARESAPQGSVIRDRLTRLIDDYTGMEEFVAHRGFGQTRIIAYAELNGDMLRQYYNDHNSPLFTQAFWSSRWMNNAQYDTAFDHDTTSILTYANVGGPRGSISQVMNGTQPPVPLRFTCMGVSSQPHLNNISLNTDQVCSSHQYMEYKRKLFDPRLYILFTSRPKSK